MALMHMLALASASVAFAANDYLFEEVGFMRTDLVGRGVAVQLPYAYLIVGAEPVEPGLHAPQGRTSRLVAVDVSDTSNPRNVSAVDIAGDCGAVWVEGARAHVVCGAAGLVAVDISDPLALRVMSVLTPQPRGLWTHITGVQDTVFVADAVQGVYVVALSTSAVPNMSVVDTIPVRGGAVGMAFDAGLLFTASPALGVVVVNTTTRSIVATAATAGMEVAAVAARDDTVCVASRDGGVEVFRVRNTASTPLQLVSLGNHSHPAADVAMPPAPANLWAYVVYAEGDRFGVIDVSSNDTRFLGTSSRIEMLSGVDAHGIAVSGDTAFAAFHAGLGIFVTEPGGGEALNANFVVVIVIGSLLLCGALLYWMCNTQAWNTWLDGGRLLDVDGRRVADASSAASTLSDAGKERVKRRRARRALTSALVFCVLFMITEAVGGWLANSIAVLSDAAHMATDVAALALSLYALHASGKPRSMTYTYGWHRVEVVGALISLLTIWFLTGIIVYEAVRRLGTKEEVDGRLMMMLGGAGLFVNLLVAYILAKGNAEVMHTHSHGDSGVCPSKGAHGHSHGHAHSHSHGHSRAHGEAAAVAHADAADYGTANGRETQGLLDAEAGGHGHTHGADADIPPSHSHSGLTHSRIESAAARSEAADSMFSVRKGENVNVKSAMIHAIGDCVQSAGVMLAAGIIWIGNVQTTGEPKAYGTPYNNADPITSFVFAAVTLFTTVGMFKQIVGVLLEASCGLPYEEIMTEFGTTFGADNVHDLHLWSLTLGKPALSVHIVSADHVGALYKAKSICMNHDIEHTTIQIDPPGDGHGNCGSMICPDHTVVVRQDPTK